MIRELKEGYSYKKTMLILSVLTFAFGLAFAMISELFLPFAVAFCANLFLFEKPKGRFLSYIVPAVPVVLDIVFSGLYGLISIVFILLALILVSVYLLLGHKSECAIYLSLIASAFILLSFYLYGAKAVSSFDLDDIFGFYRNSLEEIKNAAYKLTNISSDNGAYQQISEYEFSVAFNRLTMQIASFIGISAFVFSGISIKLFTWTTLKISKKGILGTFAHFLPTNISAYTFALVLVISIFSSAESAFGIVTINLLNILTVIFAYLGGRYIFTMASISGKRAATVLISIGAFLMFPSVALRIASIVGAWITIGTNNAMREIAEK